MFGFLNINKASGLTSHDVVARVRRLVARKTKVGHAGTLDPAATGVLPVAIGAATRLIPYLTDTHKGYQAIVALGVTTTTDDAEGQPVEQRPVPALDIDTIEAVLAHFRGTIQQVPPMYSAIHHQGQRLYALARQGQTVERAPRTVTIERLHLLAHTEQQFTLAVTCSKGTYIRSLARDIGAALGCGAHLAALERTFVGSFTVEQAVTLETLNTQQTIAPYLLPPDIAVAHWPRVDLDEQQSQRIGNGQSIRLADIAEPQARAYSPEGFLLALLKRVDEQTWQPEKVFGR